MLDFRRRQRRAVNYLGSPVQRRLLLLMGLAGLVLILTLKAGDERMWRWMVWEQPPAQKSAARSRPPSASGLESPAAAPAVAGADVPPIEVDPAELASAKQLDPGDLLPGVRPDYLATVRDDTVFLPDEADAWFHLFDVVGKADPEDLDRAALEDVGYLQLDQQPKEYRGRVIKLSGIVRGVKLVETPVNAFNVERYYQLWIQPERASPALVVVYCLKLPEGFPVGEQLDAPVQLTAIFFKRWTYSSRGGITTAPLLVAKTLTWMPAPPPAPSDERSRTVEPSLAVITAVVLAVGVIAVLAWRTRTRSRHDDSSIKPFDRWAAELASLEASAPSPSASDSPSVGPLSRNG